MSIGREYNVQYIMFYNHVCTEEEEEEDESVDGIRLGSPLSRYHWQTTTEERERTGREYFIIIMLWRRHNLGQRCADLVWLGYVTPNISLIHSDRLAWRRNGIPAWIHGIPFATRERCANCQQISYQLVVI